MNKLEAENDDYTRGFEEGLKYGRYEITALKDPEIERLKAALAEATKQKDTFVMRAYDLGQDNEILKNRLSWAQAENKQLREGLRYAEQIIGGLFSTYRPWPCCFGEVEYNIETHRYVGHKPDCWLDKLVGEGRE